MNIGIVTSFIVGGILLISMLNLNRSVNQFSSSSTMNLVNQESMKRMTQLMEDDFQKIGHNIPNFASPFITANDNRISFRSDLYFGDDQAFSIVTWEMTPDENDVTDNPNDYILKRSNYTPGGIEIMTNEYSATHFKVEYLNQQGNPVINPNVNTDRIFQVRVELIVESGYPIMQNGKEKYDRRVWTKTFFPANVQFLNQ